MFELLEPCSIPYVMVVESDPDLAQALLCMLQQEMKQLTLLATTVKDALNITQALKPLLVLANDSLSDGKGTALYSRMRQRRGFQEVPFVLLSTRPHLYEGSAETQKIILLGLPVDLSELISTVTDCLPQKKEVFG